MKKGAINEALKFALETRTFYPIFLAKLEGFVDALNIPRFPTALHEFFFYFLKDGESVESKKNYRAPAVNM